MSRRVIIVFVLVAVLVVGGAAALVVTSRPDLEDGRDAVDTRWATLVGPLASRYDGLDQLAAALAAAGAGERTYTVDLTDGVKDWNALTTGSARDPGAEAEVANRLEGLAVRTRVNVARSAKLSRDPAVTAALTAFDAALVPTDEVGAYNRAVRRYQDTRTDTLTQVPADLLGYDPRPILVVGVSPATG